MDLLDLYGRASGWANNLVAGATDNLNSPTPCAGWDVRELLNHMLETQRYFVGAARGDDVAPPSSSPPELIGEDPTTDFETARSETLSTFGEDGVIERTGPSLGIAFSDQLLHGWDLARATGQDARMPDDLAQAAYETIYGLFTDEQRPGVFGPELAVPAGASAQDKLLAYTGRNPAA